MINYESTLKGYETDNSLIKLKKASKLNFLKANETACELAIIYHFLKYSESIQDSVMSSIKTNSRILLDKMIPTLKLGVFKLKVYQSNSNILLLFYNDDFKLSKISFANHIITLYKIINEIFVRAKLTYLNVIPNVDKKKSGSTYIIAFTVEHGPEITVSIQDIIDRYKSLISTEQFNQKMERLTKKNEDIEEEPSQTDLEFDIDSLNMTNFFNFTSSN
ncbi:MAG: hypothetical protein QW478_07040 [Candidatus Micrarchaeaceae archaeon]